jgi:hypothetical protein
MLVDRHGVIGIFNDAAELSVVELVKLHVDIFENVERHAERADGIPNADEFNLDFAAKRRTEQFRRDRIDIIAPRAINSVGHHST